ncbi:2-polyprenyl-6-methoxyphenol hydroxylase-like FAD-dependent oxidoreductase [Bradyrhizobium japonicum]|jgi:2-polyprenyl-6-methoxyphenol hydroxylase-like FAD-dependent oxidoreductase|uniref:2-polyprenyl-6-methoxyphenol hydroxylase-like FAD-dependent oxidoreductase n=1 Tax=Bradyrhizobium elkanii TaxID=29448 RepID=A0ABV4FC40_BRAEL|nr:FAD binding domain-containing protein [Bradyrhizobium elkanii]MBP2431879.1 2-polyprenyl-6-methoxyphenol hydroxylase-like FAD-dependent oxidoreductase [Bradyrhizobium elkanii]MCP1735049.1 2-polyprenyl-6-methoxyphenol hydroxylase-like FAD-dependent oxidoreductase [Bradyrhizobium elkanii]MCP1752592.1 2-polyprenyl-6-methoxyphenol hydroxylase-like FAD-dependent oxidoreductase [Bradyrhizobium elkanii]MCP1978365.1 2-polyprenyl-6-methoxyphenol hydroxylase-like FAD-dependent oxidoreductase [Bradyrhiz
MSGDRWKRRVRPKALVIGGSMAGLFAALLLRREGWNVDVYERIGSELAGRGAGIVTHHELFEVLGRAGIDTEAAAVGVVVPGRRVLDRSGRIVGELGLRQVLTSWGHLYGLLKAALPAEDYHHGKNLVEVAELGDRVVARFSDGSEVSADLLIGADGIFSCVRAQLAIDVRPAYVGYVAWRGLVNERDLSPRTRAELCDWFAFSLPPGEQMLGYPVAGTKEEMDVGERRFNFVWYRPANADHGLADLLTDIDGIRHELSIPPTKIRSDVIASMRQDAERLLAPQFAEVVRLTPQPFMQAILDLETPRMALGSRTVILGDAAFVARPHVGMGVTKAAADAAALVDALRAHPADLPAALAEFESIRLPFGAAVVRRARHLGAYMQAQIATAEERAMAERHRSPEAVMAETAVATGIAA